MSGAQLERCVDGLGYVSTDGRYRIDPAGRTYGRPHGWTITDTHTGSTVEVDWLWQARAWVGEQTQGGGPVRPSRWEPRLFPSRNSRQQEAGHMRTTMSPYELADAAIGLFLEYRDVHGQTEEHARASAALEVQQGVEAEVELRAEGEIQ